MASDGNQRKPGASTWTSRLDTPRSAVPGKRTLTESLAPQAASAAAAPAVQRCSGGEPVGAAHDDHTIQDAAARGVATPASPLPHGATIQQLFGRRDISLVQAHTGPEAAASTAAMGAEAYATGEHVVLRRTDLHTVAHEAAHVVQQRDGVQLKGGVGQAGDAYERHADEVADAVVAGKSVEDLLGQMPGGGQRGAAVQRAGASPDRIASPDAAITPPTGGIDKPGFIDHGDGAFIRTGPREAGGAPIRDAPLPPATRVFATGTHPHAHEWMYVTAFPAHEIVRGYVQGFRVNLELPEPLAELRQLHGGETVEGLAKEKFGHAVHDGHDLRFYENVLLYVNKGRAGIAGAYQDPGVFGGGANNIQLRAGHRIWLVSAEFAKSLESIVPSGSLTGGAVAKARRFAGHVQDILHSVTESRRYLGEVAGEYAQAIREHQNAIFGIVGGFLMAEAASALLAATPTGVTQIIAVLIQLTLSALGAAGMVEAGAAAVQHGAAWLTTAWTANGKPEKLADASREFIKMLVSIAMAALSYLGAKGNYGNALKIASSMPTGGLPALAIVGGGQRGAGAGTPVLIGPSGGSLGVGGAVMSKVEGEDGGGGHDKPKAGEAEPGRNPDPQEKTATKDAAEAASKKSSKDAAVEAGQEHVHRGGIVKDPQSPYFGKWDGTGIHNWDELVAMCQRDGFRIKSVTEDPLTGIRRVEIERVGIHPKTGAAVRGFIEKTIYPKRLSAAQIDAAGESALEAALNGESGTKLQPPGTKLKRDGTPADGFFEATVRAGEPSRDIRIQGWYKQTPGGGKAVTSHTPVYQDNWPVVDPKDF